MECWNYGGWLNGSTLDFYFKVWCRHLRRVSGFILVVPVYYSWGSVTSEVWQCGKNRLSCGTTHTRLVSLRTFCTCRFSISGHLSAWWFACLVIRVWWGSQFWWLACSLCAGCDWHFQWLACSLTCVIVARWPGLAFVACVANHGRDENSIH